MGVCVCVCVCVFKLLLKENGSLTKKAVCGLPGSWTGGSFVVCGCFDRYARGGIVVGSCFALFCTGLLGGSVLCVW